MADMKVVTSTPNETESKNGVSTSFNEFDSKAMKLEEATQEFQEKLAKKKYRVKTTVDTLTYLTETFYNNVSWSGYECYAISETHKELTKVTEKFATKEFTNDKRSFSMKVEVLEALFHFVKSHAGTGLNSAQSHRLLCEDLSVPMSELNTDRTALREMAMEAEAAKHGITVDDYKKAADAMHAQNNAPQPNLQ